MSMCVDKQDVLKRIHYIEGHLGGIGRMIEEDATCIDVLRQTYAVRKAIEKLETLLVEKHLAICIHQAIMDGDEKALLAEFVQFYRLGGNLAR
jgi:DNA-binding FrmR family transcriptional regulator